MRKFKLILLLIISLFITINSANALDIAQYTKGQRTESNNYGVEKKWEITSENKSNVLNTPYVDETIKVYDFSDVLTDSEKESLQSQINTFIEKYDTELIIVTYNLPYSSDYANEEFAADFYDYNSFGINYDLYDGIVLFRNTYEPNPYYDMYTFGEAQLYFDQSRYDYILDGIYNSLHGGNYYYGFSLFISYTSNYMDAGIPSSLKNYKVNDMGYLELKYNPPILLAIVISGIATAILLGILISKNKMVKKATAARVYLDKSSIKFTKLIDRFTNSITTHYTISSSSSGGGGGHHSSGGSSGGGHSSGGGRHG